ncbi:MAG: BON domain-containing protein [Acidobacteriota bacterium]|nr:BON domain-containing protein [Acidobacteriota bacterium]
MARATRTPLARVMRYLGILLIALVAGVLATQVIASLRGGNQPTMYDRWILVKLRLRYNFALSLHRDLEVSVLHGLVTLSGSVATPQDRDRAVAIAKRTRGVTGVINLLSVARPATIATPAAPH